MGRECPLDRDACACAATGRVRSPMGGRTHRAIPLAPILPPACPAAPAFSPLSPLWRGKHRVLDDRRNPRPIPRPGSNRGPCPHSHSPALPGFPRCRDGAPRSRGSGGCSRSDGDAVLPDRRGRSAALFGQRSCQIQGFPSGCTPPPTGPNESMVPRGWPSRSSRLRRSEPRCAWPADWPSARAGRAVQCVIGTVWHARDLASE